LAKQLLDLDIFKLDIIARELKDMEELLKSCYKSVPQDKVSSVHVLLLMIVCLMRFGDSHELC
jgi:hypothetical protein